MEELAFVWVAEIGQLVAPDSHGLLLILLLLLFRLILYLHLLLPLSLILAGCAALCQGLRACFVTLAPLAFDQLRGGLLHFYFKNYNRAARF